MVKLFVLGGFYRYDEHMFSLDVREEKLVTKSYLMVVLDRLFKKLVAKLITKQFMNRWLVNLKKYMVEIKMEVRETRRGVLSTEKAILDKLKEHEERLNALEDLHPPIN